MHDIRVGDGQDHPRLAGAQPGIKPVLQIITSGVPSIATLAFMP